MIDQERRRIAVLGGTGFIGRALCEALSGAGDEVFAFARNEPAVLPAGSFRRFDLGTGTPAELAEILRADGVDTVVNAAGGMWGLTDEQMVDANVGMVRRIMEALTLLQGPVRLVQLGSVHEYGLAPVGTVQSEDFEPRPQMVYGELKLESTRLIAEAVSAGELDAVVLRVGNVVGAGQPGHSLLGVMARKLAEASAAGVPAELTLAPLTARRDFLGLADAVLAVSAAIRAAAPAPVVNVGRGEGVSARTMVELLIEVSGVPTVVTEDPGPVGAGPETDWQCLDAGLARRTLGWEPLEPLSAAVKGLWQAVASEQG
ncbi:NAD-dependent epimerase/dehydratase family protein [Streptacidiphilus sp. N1-12]|uniref:NAD-dependent epimerase/dehydratase family protein n=2 Tax=Streptacidiphilus alkalitolerans TaxID=3342712 RepID=A0ABV6X427_9ACTN